MRREPQVSGRQLCGCPPSLPRFDASRELSEEGAKVGNGEKHSGWAQRAVHTREPFCGSVGLGGENGRDGRQWASGGCRGAECVGLVGRGEDLDLT